MIRPPSLMLMCMCDSAWAPAERQGATASIAAHTSTAITIEMRLRR